MTASSTNFMGGPGLGIRDWEFGIGNSGLVNGKGRDSKVMSRHCCLQCSKLEDAGVGKKAKSWLFPIPNPESPIPNHQPHAAKRKTPLEAGPSAVPLANAISPESR
jgi:hypothetical protein